MSHFVLPSILKTFIIYKSAVKLKLAIGYGNLLGTFLTTNLFGKEIAQNLPQLRGAATTKMEL